MSCLGVHFALEEEDVAPLRAMANDGERLEYVQEVLEERYVGDGLRAAESDKGWDAMHRALADGHLTWSGGTYPLNHVVLAGEILYEGSDYIMSLKSPAQVRDIAAAIKNLSLERFRAGYFAIDTDEYDSELSEADLNYTWESFQQVRELYARAATDGRWVLFTADQ